MLKLASSSRRRIAVYTGHLLKKNFASANVTGNPLLKTHTLPPFKLIRVDHIEPAMEVLLSKYEKSIDGLEEQIDNKSVAGWNVFNELELIEQPVEDAWGVVSHLQGVKNSDDLRKAHEKVLPNVIKTMTKSSQSVSIYKALELIKEDTNQWNKLSKAQQRIVDQNLTAMRNQGVNLEGDQQQRFNEIKMELADLSTKFSNNVLDATKEWSLIITDSSEIEGFPTSLKALTAQQAGSNDIEKGPWKLTLDYPVLGPVLQHARNRQLREQIYMANVTKAGEVNAPIIAKILSLRKEKANLLNYNCHADLSLETKMAGNTDNVDELVEQLRNKAYPCALKEYKKLTKFANLYGHKGKLEPWDTTFFSERQREKLFEFTQEELRPYFSLPDVLTGLFTLCEKLFNVHIMEVSNNDGNNTNDSVQTWHEDVSFFHVLSKDNANEHIASFYLDPYSRPEEKSGGAWMAVCRQRSDLLDRKPVAYLTCNGTPPIKDAPSLMTFVEVTTLFHEFGHGLQHMLTKIPYSRCAGIAGIEWDAVELPSQFMENWCYHKPTVDSFAKHYQTGETIDETLFQKVCDAKKHNAGSALLRQLYFGKMDMALHSTFNPSLGIDGILKLQHEIAEDYTVSPPLNTDRFLCSFSHIFAGGYSAGYYSYIWAEVLSADAFAAFEEVGLDNEKHIEGLGRKFADTVLGCGGGEHPADVYKRFRGRLATADALLRHRGVV
jgi:oligopeptidase A